MIIVNHNLAALNASNQLKTNTEQTAKSDEKLSSGFRINRAADDAAGLTISEKMRKFIKGLNRGSKNVQDAVSLIQTTEGALGEIHDILQRMHELSVQAANETNSSIDRDAVKSELTALEEEINRISLTTKFNERTVLTTKPQKLVIIDAEDYSAILMDDVINDIPLDGGGTRASAHGKVIDFVNVNEKNKKYLFDKEFSLSCSANCAQKFTFKFTEDTTSSAAMGQPTSDSLTVSIGLNDDRLKSGADIVKEIYEQAKSKRISAGGSGEVAIGHANGMSFSESKLIMYSFSGGPTYAPGMGTIFASDIDVVDGEEDINIQTNDEPFRSLTFTLRTINATTLGVSKLDVSSYDKATATMKRIDEAIDGLSEYRSYLGAVQNRFEHELAYNQNTEENTQAAESRIRDTDMAEKIVARSRSKILENVSQSMLSHCFQDADGVLSLIT